MHILSKGLVVMKSSTPFRAVLGAAALAAAGALFVAGPASAQDADQLLTSIEQNCVGLYDAANSTISSDQHASACGCVNDTLGGRDMSIAQLQAVDALFRQDFEALTAMDASMSDGDKAGLEAALEEVNNSCDPGA